MQKPDFARERVSVGVVQGVEGQALYVNDYRVAGPKPWGGGAEIRKWTRVTTGDVLDALPSVKRYIAALEEERDKFEAMADALASKKAP